MGKIEPFNACTVLFLHFRIRQDIAKFVDLVNKIISVVDQVRLQITKSTVLDYHKQFPCIGEVYYILLEYSVGTKIVQRKRTSYDAFGAGPQ
jgi:hypothetical protein